jgi:hypothetical protein
MPFHQVAIFFFPVVLADLWRQTRKLSAMLRYGVAVFLLTAGTYVLAYRGVSNVGGFLDWITTHSTDSARV